MTVRGSAPFSGATTYEGVIGAEYSSMDFRCAIQLATTITATTSTAAAPIHHTLRDMQTPCSERVCCFDARARVDGTSSIAAAGARCWGTAGRHPCLDAPDA